MKNFMRILKVSKESIIAIFFSWTSRITKMSLDVKSDLFSFDQNITIIQNTLSYVRDYMIQNNCNFRFFTKLTS